MGIVMVLLIEIIAWIAQGIGSFLIRSKPDIDRIERQIERREQGQRRRSTEEK